MAPISSGKVIQMVLILCLLYLTACLSPNPLIQESSVSVLGSLRGQQLEEIAEALIIIGRGKHIYEEVVPVFEDTFVAELQIPVGQWELTVLLVNQEGKALYQSSTNNIEVNLNQTTICEVILGPANCTISIEIDLSNYVFRKDALRARIHFDDTVHELIREDPDQPFCTEIEVAPGSYEFTVELFTESFRVGDRIGPGYWQIIDVLPDEELAITFHPATQILDVTGWIELLPPAPINVQIELIGNEVHLCWEALPDPIQGYFILAQTDPLKRFQLLNTIPVSESCFVHDLEGESFPLEICYSVAAVSNNGLVGFYSTPETLLAENN